MTEEKTRNIIEKIKSEHIVPEPKWKLNLKSYIFWVIWFSMIIFGAVSFSLIIFNFLDLGSEFFRYLRLGGVLRVFAFTAPYFWLAILALALVSGFFALRKTKRGYRYSILFATSLAVLLVSSAGALVHFSKINDRIARGIERGFPEHPGIFSPGGVRWEKPDEGLLGGKIVELNDQKNSFMLEDFRGEDWQINYSQETEIRMRRGLEKDFLVGVIGEKTGEREFEAKFIKSLRNGGPGAKPGRRMNPDFPDKKEGVFPGRMPE